MQIELLTIGKTAFDFISKGITEYENRLKHYTKFSVKELKQAKYSKTDSIEVRKHADSQTLLSEISDSAFVVLLDEGGKTLTSVGFAQSIEQWQMQNVRHVQFVIGGAYGFSPEAYKRANAKWQLSALTFPHDLVRLVFVEQLYRAHTIVKGEQYHHI